MLKLRPEEYLLLLKIYKHPDDADGTALREHLAAKLDQRISIGGLFTLINRLKDKSLIQPYLRRPPSGGRACRCYRIKPAGKQAIDEYKSDTKVSAVGLVA